MAEPEKTNNEAEESGGGDRMRTLATFMAGVLVGGAFVYFSPPVTEGGAPQGQMPGDPNAMGGAPLQPPPGSDGTPGVPGAPPDGSAGTPGAPPTGSAPGVPGAPPDGTAGTPGVPGAPPDGSTPGVPGAPPDGTAGTPGTPGAMPDTPGTPPGTPGAIPGTPGATTGTPGTVGGTETLPLPPGTPDPSLQMADGGVGKPEYPPPGNETPSPTPANPPPPGGTRIERHLRAAAGIWQTQLDAAKASKSPAIQALVPQIKAHIANIPTVGTTLPTMPEVAAYLADSRVLVDRMATAGMNVADLSTEISTLLRPPKGPLPPPSH